MSSATLGGTYVLSDEGVRQLAELDRSTPPVDSANFVSRRIDLPDDRAKRLAKLNQLVSEK